MRQVLLTIWALVISTNLWGQQLKAYYTKIERGSEWEALSRTTEHPDVVVEVNEGQLIFWRGTSFLPVWTAGKMAWPVPEVIARSGDGPAERPDATNSFSFVRIIDASDQQVVIHWRYLPEFGKGNPKPGVDHLTFVDEYFTIDAAGHVLRTIKQGTPKVDDWISSSGLITQSLDLTALGITNVEHTTNEGGLGSVSRMFGNPLTGAPVKPPVTWFPFDGGMGEQAKDSISGEEATVEGHKTYWKQGVSGTALAFDGYNSRIAFPSLNGGDNLTTEAWVALGAYPFNWAPIVHQSEYEESGFYLGVGPSGKVTFRLYTDQWHEVTTDRELPLRQWTHVAATHDGSQATIYINGEVVKTEDVSGSILSADAPLLIGFNSHKQIPGDPVRPDCEECHTPSLFGFDGLIDEVRLYNTSFSEAEVKESFENYNTEALALDQPDLQERALPRGPSTGNFEAHYTSLKYYETWDNLARFGDHADVVVEFDDLPTKFIFWRGMSYVPQVINAENQWYNNQFNESWDAGGSWGEPMSDKQSMRSHVRIIQNTPARKVIHWRYAQVQINGTQQNYDEETGWGDWSDWYYFIYPDGVATKRMVHWSGDDPLDHEWQESIGVMGPGQTPEDISYVYDQTVTFDDFKVTKSYDWGELDPDANVPLVLEEMWERRPLNIQVVNYKSDYKPFTIGDFRGGECYGDFDGRIAPYSNIVVYIHWPLGQLPTDGTRAFHPDRGSSNGYTHLMFKGSHRLGKNWAERVMLEGMTTKSAVELRPLASSWLKAPKVKNLEGAEGGAYDQAQRAYQFQSTGSGPISFSIAATEKSPVENLCLVIQDWGTTSVELTINGQQAGEAEGLRVGYETTAGKANLVLWMDLSTDQATRFTIIPN